MLNQINSCPQQVNQWIVKVRNGPYQFTPTAGQPHSKPLTINKNIQLIADQGAVALDGGAGSVFLGNVAMCDSVSGCFTDPSRANPNCYWAQIQDGMNNVIADGNALIIINPTRMTDHRNDWDILIKNFEVRNAFRTAQIPYGQPYLVYTTVDPNLCVGQTPTLVTANRLPGGGLEAWFSRVTIEDCNFHHNSVTEYAGAGGGVFASTCHLTVRNCTFEKNFGGYYGGGLFASQGALGVGSPCVNASVPPGESPPRPLYPRGNVDVVIEGSVFRDNFPEFGGAIQLGSQACMPCNGDVCPGPPIALEPGSYCDTPPLAVNAPRVTLTRQ